MSAIIRPGTTILFQGDSITDMGRSRSVTSGHSIHSLGSGYAYMAAAKFMADRPGERLSFFNRGISGNRIVDLYARITSDTIDLRPDILSVLIGVNDTWHRFGGDNGVAVPEYERTYRDYLSEIRKALPGIRFILCEPFVLRCGVVTDEWIDEMEERRSVVAGLAKEFSAILVPFQEMFDRALAAAPAEYWADDGVHPTPAGHHLMAEAWLKAIASFKAVA